MREPDDDDTPGNETCETCGSEYRCEHLDEIDRQQRAAEAEREFQWWNGGRGSILLGLDDEE